MDIEIIAYSEKNGTVIYREGDAHFVIAPPYIPASVSEIPDPTSDLITNRDYTLASRRFRITSYDELQEWATDEAAPTSIRQPQCQRQSQPEIPPQS